MTLIKWPGGKTRELFIIKHLIPNYDRYIEPFFGGGAVFFDQKPEVAFINDISTNLVDFYKLIKANDMIFFDYLNMYNSTWIYLLSFSENNLKYLRELYFKYKNNTINEEALKTSVENFISQNKCVITPNINLDIILDTNLFYKKLIDNLFDKLKRIKSNEYKNGDLSLEDLNDNIKTGIMSGTYMYFRDLYNFIQLAKPNYDNLCIQFKVANFYFIREFCYGSMFRYNKSGEFNIPYGGISYNNKDFAKKINTLFEPSTFNLFINTEIFNLDFEVFINTLNLTENDFIFLDPPYDTDFSDYEGRSFSLDDQKRLCHVLTNTLATFILVIKNTDYIYNLYSKTNLNILSFEKQYTYNVKSRNNRSVDHLIITNINIQKENL